MSEPRTHQLLHVELDSTPGYDGVTVPAGERWLVKYVSAVTTATAAADLQVLIVHGGASGWLLLEHAPGANTLYDVVECYGVLEEGDTLFVACGSLGSDLAFFHVGGLIFTL